MKITQFKSQINYLWLALATISFQHAVLAQEQTANDAPRVIEIKAEREHLVDYQQPYEAAKKTQVASHGHVAFAYQLVPKNSTTRIDDVKIWLESPSKSIPIKILDGNFFIVPVDDQIAEEKGKFAINKKGGEVTGVPSWIQVVPNKDWTIGLMKQVIDETNLAINKFLPWYGRPFAPKVKSIAVCSKEPSLEIQIKDGDKIAGSVVTKDAEKNDANRPVFCTRFDASTKFSDDSRVVVPDSAEVILM